MYLRTRGSFKSANHQNNWVRKSQIRSVSHFRKVRKSNKLFNDTNLRICSLRNLFADRPPLLVVHSLYITMRCGIFQVSHGDNITVNCTDNHEVGGNKTVTFLEPIWISLIAHCKQYPIYVLPEMKLRDIVLNFHYQLPELVLLCLWTRLQCLYYVLRTSLQYLDYTVCYTLL